MLPHYGPKETIRERLLRDLSAIQCLLRDANPADGELVLERLPSGEYAWLRPDVRYVLTDQGRAAIRNDTD